MPLPGEWDWTGNEQPPSSKQSSSSGSSGSWARIFQGSKDWLANNWASLAELGLGYYGYKGQRKANDQNIEFAREQMAFQERMSNTAYQRAAKDLESAGLNRILALGSPASSPGGATATMQNENAAGIAGAQGALAMKAAAAQLKNTKVTNQLIQEQIQKTRNEANTAHETMVQNRMWTKWLQGDPNDMFNMRNAGKLWDAQQSQQVAQAALTNYQVPHSANAAAYSQSGLGKGLQWFGMGARDIGPAVIGATGAAGASALFKMKSNKQFANILGKGLSQGN